MAEGHPKTIPQEDIDDLADNDPEQLELIRERISKEYFEEGNHHHHVTARERTILRDNLVRIHKALTSRGIVPKRIER